MRRKDREKNRDFALSVTDKCEWATLSMADADGMPYCVPVSIVRDGDAIYFHAAKSGKKTDYMRANSNVCLACVGDTERLTTEFSTAYESAILRGEASEVTEIGEKSRALRLLCLRHCPSNMDNFDVELARSFSVTAVWKIAITDVTGKCKAKKTKNVKN